MVCVSVCVELRCDLHAGSSHQPSIHTLRGCSFSQAAAQKGGKTSRAIMGPNMDVARRSWGVLLVFLLDLLGVAATNMEPIYWNSLNER